MAIHLYSFFELMRLFSTCIKTLEYNGATIHVNRYWLVYY